MVTGEVVGHFAELEAAKFNGFWVPRPGRTTAWLHPSNP
jgi:hypothetical protein